MEKRTVVCCVGCNHEFGSAAFSQHHPESVSCKKLQADNMVPDNLVCTFCEKQMVNKSSYKNHSQRCKENPHRVVQRGMAGKIPWIKGKCKDNCDILAKTALENSIKLKGKIGRKWTQEEKNKLSAHARSHGYGGVKQSQKTLYKGVLLESSYEVAVAMSLDAYFVEWEKPGRFNYIDCYGKNRTYRPDLYLPKYDIYLDPKNDFLINNINPTLKFKDVDKIQWVCEQNDITVLILNKNQLSWSDIKALLVHQVE